MQELRINEARYARFQKRYEMGKNREGMKRKTKIGRYVRELKKRYGTMYISSEESKGNVQDFRSNEMKRIMS